MNDEKHYFWSVWAHFWTSSSVLTLSFTVGTAAVSSNTPDGLQSHGFRLARQTGLTEGERAGQHASVFFNENKCSVFVDLCLLSVSSLSSNRFNVCCFSLLEMTSNDGLTGSVCADKGADVSPADPEFVSG